MILFLHQKVQTWKLSKIDINDLNPAIYVYKKTFSRDANSLDYFQSSYFRCSSSFLFFSNLRKKYFCLIFLTIQLNKTKLKEL